jgi:crotonobetainyl-CoA:carnitine CoA-transferase CaiB-like acyl-CoA transferase
VKLNEALPLSGVRIADFTWIGAGPTATRFLAFFGAEVIIVESWTRSGVRTGEPQGKSLLPESEQRKTMVSSFGYAASSPNISGFFNNLNSGKRSVTLDMRRSEAKEIARDLIRHSDIVVNNFAPGVMDRWGLGYAELVKLRPDIIMAEMPIAGTWGPHKTAIGYGATVEAFVGLNELTGYPDMPPTGTEINYPDYGSNPYHLAVALLGALHHRHQTGEGQYIEIAQWEATASVLETMVLDYTVNGTIQTRDGNRVSHAAPHNVYPCQGEDRWVAIAVETDTQWQALTRIIGEPKGLDPARLAGLDGRKEHEAALDDWLAAWTASRSADDVMTLLQSAGIAAGVVQSIADTMNDPQLRDRGFYVRLEHPELGPTTYDGLAVRLSETPGAIHAPAPCLGEGNDYVFRDLLGIPEDTVNQLIIDEVIY